MMANPRRNSHSSSGGSNHQISISVNNNNNNDNSFSNQFEAARTRMVSWMKIVLLKKPILAFPFLLSMFLFLTWVSLRLQQSSSKLSSPALSLSHQQQQQQQQDQTTTTPEEDHKAAANLVTFTSSGYPSPISKDKRGWLLDPLSVALHAGISGGAVTCASLHIGEIRPGGSRGNHRHYTCNETFLIWGAKTIFRLQNNAVNRGYAEVTIGADEVAVAASPSGTAHALVNVDPVQSTFFVGCQDSVINYNSSTSDFNVWKDL